MTPDRFAELATAHGGDIGRWPQDLREAARAALASDPHGLGAVLAAEADLDRLLDLAPAQSADAALLGRLLEAAPRPRRSTGAWWAGLAAGLGLAAATVAGVAVGVASGAGERLDRRADAILAAAYEPAEPDTTAEALPELLDEATDL
ncbi:hypothetical protein DDF62_02955 [Caulobacter radicis]|uniref:hypothetical protein n=1 Tax=Caulobacter radicis TaxID=2172650 RepID=UPI000D58378D|nr:hypothetical protein [Caulobacter radicis]PVM92129.1 hypothetical protein DDF62_02955 [Caulobacter radicis]